MLTLQILGIIAGVVAPLAGFTTYRYRKMGKVTKLNNEESGVINANISFFKNAQREKEYEDSSYSHTNNSLQRAIAYNTTEISASKFQDIEKNIQSLNEEIKSLQNKLRQAKKDAAPILAEMQRQREIREAKERAERAKQEAIEAEARKKREEEERQARRRRDEEDSIRRSSSSYYDSSSSSSSSSSWSGGGGDSSGGGSSDSW